MHSPIDLQLRTSALAALTLLLSGCPRPRSPEPPAPNGPPDPTRLLAGPLSALPPEIKASDFRVTPPAVEEIRARPAPDGSTLLDVKMAPDPRLRGLKVLSLFPNGHRWDLHDDGTEGDQKANDGIFSTSSPFPFDTLLGEQRKARKLLAERKLDSIPRWRGLMPATPVRVDLLPVDTRDIRNILLLHSLGMLVARDHSLTITAVNVVEDPTRTVNPCTGAGHPLGKWTFGHLMTQMAGNVDPVAFTESFFQTLKNGEAAPNGQMMGGNPQIQTQVLDPWPKTNNHIDLARAPLKLLAIVNRIDLAGNTAYGAVSGAEGRFIFEVMDQTAPHCPVFDGSRSDPSGDFLIIVEYGVPIGGCSQLSSWANQWLALGQYPLGSSAYNSALENITERFVARDAAPGNPNGSALNHIRINQIPFTGVWNLRQLHLTTSGFLHADNTSQTPITDNTPELAAWVNGNAAEILLGTYTVPAVLNGAPFLSALVLNGGPDFWRINGVASNSVRHAFSLNTCNGCHGRETGTQFVQVGGEAGAPIGAEAGLSGFLRGEIITDPVDGSPLNFNELLRRADVLENLATSTCERIPLQAVSEPFHLPLPPVDVQPVLSVH